MNRHERKIMEVTDKMVDRFLAWPLPVSVCSDPCVTRRQEHWEPQRIGTNLLTADEARAMLEHILSDAAEVAPTKEAIALAQSVVDWDDGKKPRTASNWIHGDTIALARELLRCYGPQQR